jgi:hypothetical protein
VSAVPRGVVEMDRWVEVTKRRRREIAAAVAAFIKEACRVGDVALFGSRARGDFYDMSDWDLAVVTQDGEYAVEAEWFGQVVYTPLAKLHQILAFSALDVTYEGRLLCGRGELWQEFARKVAQYVCLLRLYTRRRVHTRPHPPHLSVALFGDSASIKVYRASLRCQVAPLARSDLNRSKNTAQASSAN